MERAAGGIGGDAKRSKSLDAVASRSGPGDAGNPKEELIMRRSICFCLTTISLFALGASAVAETDKEVAARAVALELAGAFSNDGFKLRDGHWAGTLGPNESKVIAVNLY